jgi:uncharacterized membrane protein YhaH (DUF805 family)
MARHVHVPAVHTVLWWEVISVIFLIAQSGKKDETTDGRICSNPHILRPPSGSAYHGGGDRDKKKIGAAAALFVVYVAVSVKSFSVCVKRLYRSRCRSAVTGFRFLLRIVGRLCETFVSNG